MEGDIDINPVEILLELIEVSIHNILFIRNLYPSSIFCLKKKYGVPVHVSMYPDLNLYISESLKGMKELLAMSQLEEVAICFIDEKRNKTIEKFVFNILKVRSSFEYRDRCNDPNLIRVKEAFRAFLLKLSISDSYLKPLPEGCIFKICLQTKESGSVVLSEDTKFEDFPWIELEDKETAMREPKLFPLRALDTESLHVEMYIECT